MKFLIRMYLIVVSVAVGGCAVPVLKQGERCFLDSNCDTGLRCEECIVEADFQLAHRCTRIQPLNPLSKVKGMPFNHYSWITTHISTTLVRAGVGRVVPVTTQQDTVTVQLKNGVRGFMFEVYEFNSRIWLCYSTSNKCNRRLKPLVPFTYPLAEIREFLEANPSEIVTIMIEDYVETPNGIMDAFSAAGLGPFLFPESLMPKNGSKWMDISKMIKTNNRLLIFNSKAGKGIPYKWEYLVENQYGDSGMMNGSCTERAESSPLNTRTRSLVLMNYFPSAPDHQQACIHNSKPLKMMMYTCFEAAGQRWPNFIVVDAYKRSDGGGVAEAVDEANGYLLYGCANLAYCKGESNFTAPQPYKGESNFTAPQPYKGESNFTAPQPNNDKTLKYKAPQPKNDTKGSNSTARVIFNLVGDHVETLSLYATESTVTLFIVYWIGWGIFKVYKLYLVRRRNILGDEEQQRPANQQMPVNQQRWWQHVWGWLFRPDLLQLFVHFIAYLLFTSCRGNLRHTV